jgi:serine/threonine protein kinase
VDLRRWDIIQDLFHQALARDEALRTDFLREQCKDEALREEIQSLLSCHETPHQLWERDRWTLGLKVLAMDYQLATDKDFGNYNLKGIIGRGGMGDVYLASDKRLGRHVALKFLPPSLSANADLSLRFHEEARAASSIAHANIAHIYELGNIDNREYIAMEFIDGVTLRERLKQGPIDLAEAIEISEQVGRGLAAAHAAGVLHRDIKPENIMLATDGFVKVLDFGLAKPNRNATLGKYEQSIDSGLTSPGVIMGTAAYMSPEQFAGEETDHRTDIWSLGVTLYELISGHQPFQGKTYFQLKNAILREDPLPLEILRADDSPKKFVADILTKALQKKKEDRYASIEGFVNDLKRVRLILDRDSVATALWMDHTTAAHPYPSTRAFQHTANLAETGTTTHAAKKERVLKLSIFLLMSFGFFGVLLVSEELNRVVFRWTDVGNSVFASLVHPVLHAAMNLLGGFAVGRVAMLIRPSWQIRYPVIIVVVCLGYAFFFLSYGWWLPSLAVFVLYTLPYVAASIVGASVAFRPWSLMTRWQRNSLNGDPLRARL